MLALLSAGLIGADFDITDSLKVDSCQHNVVLTEAIIDQCIALKSLSEQKIDGCRKFLGGVALRLNMSSEIN